MTTNFGLLSDRFFAEVITADALDYRMLPTLTFIISMLIALATGTVSSLELIHARNVV